MAGVPRTAVRPDQASAGVDAVAEAVVDLDAVRANVRRCREVAGPDVAVMAVVKAEGYGHGMLASARAARAAGAGWLGLARLDEALALREAGDNGPMLAWLLVPDQPRLVEAVETAVDVSVSAQWGLAEVAAAARAVGRPARVHLKIDTGLGRNGASTRDWPGLVAAARATVDAGEVEIVGVWSHLACADQPGHPSIAVQLDAFDAALAVAETAGLAPRVRHIANSAALFTLPRARYDLVRAGIACYGLSPGAAVGTPAGLGLTPAMTLRARLASVKRVPAGQGVSYGHRYVTTRPTTLGLVPLGYADGIPRAASGVGPVQVGGARFCVAGTVAMDQFVVDLGDLDARPGDEVVLFGPGRDGEPTAADWAERTGTIAYEIVTRIGGRVPRRYVADFPMVSPGPAASPGPAGSDTAGAPT